MDKQRITGDGIVSGYGLVDGRTAFAFAQDFTVLGGSLSHTVAEKICKVMDAALKAGAPCIGLNDSGGARIQEGVESLGGYADIFCRNTLARGSSRRFPACMGPCAGGRTLFARAHRFHLHGRQDQLHVHHRPDVIKTVTRER
jgi:propionyl-CoA carboxylase beta chain